MQHRKLPRIKRKEKMRELPKIKIGRKTYFVDEKLNELRNIKNPHDTEKMEASEEFYIKTFRRTK